VIVTVNGSNPLIRWELAKRYSEFELLYRQLLSAWGEERGEGMEQELSQKFPGKKVSMHQRTCLTDA
jgi:hypothetical protein